MNTHTLPEAALEIEQPRPVYFSDLANNYAKGVEQDFDRYTVLETAVRWLDDKWENDIPVLKSHEIDRLIRTSKGIAPLEVHHHLGILPSREMIETVTQTLSQQGVSELLELSATTAFISANFQRAGLEATAVGAKENPISFHPTHVMTNTDAVQAFPDAAVMFPVSSRTQFDRVLKKMQPGIVLFPIFTGAPSGSVTYMNGGAMPNISGIRKELAKFCTQIGEDVELAAPRPFTRVMGIYQTLAR